MIESYTTEIRYVEALKRDVEITLLSNVSQASNAPLLIMHDGQNLFEDTKAAFKKCWGLVDLMKQDALPKCRIIGLSNNQIGHGRVNEYSPYVCTDEFGLNSLYKGHGGLGDLYLNWIMRELVPEYQARYATSSVYMAGSSMGGYISLCAALCYPKELDGIIGLSNAWWFAYQPLKEAVRAFKGCLPKLYLDTGTDEAEDLKLNQLYLELHRDLCKELQDKNPNVMVQRIIAYGQHHETAWRARIAEILNFILNS